MCSMLCMSFVFVYGGVCVCVYYDVVIAIASWWPECVIEV